MTAKVTYQGELRTQCEHLQSGAQFITDAPVDNQGKGEAFSPTDTVATGLASCMLTIMGIKAGEMGIDIAGTHASVKKHMDTNPRRISKIEVHINFEQSFSKKDTAILENAAKTCPVLYSLHPDIEKEITFSY